jgi:hypothetical protein
MGWRIIFNWVIIGGCGRGKGGDQWGAVASMIINIQVL